MALGHLDRYFTAHSSIIDPVLRKWLFCELFLEWGLRLSQVVVQYSRSFFLCIGHICEAKLKFALVNEIGSWRHLRFLNGPSINT